MLETNPGEDNLTQSPQAGPREWIGLAIITIACVLYSMDLTVLHLAVPQISATLHPSSVQLLWIVDIYGFLLAGALTTMGVLGDRFGRRKLLLIGMSLFGLTAMVAAFSVTPEMLIAARALQGLAAATLAPSTLSLIRNMFPDSRQRSLAIAVWIGSFSGGAAIGPLVGGALLANFWWGSVFLIDVPLILLFLVLAPRFLPEYRNEQVGWPDALSAAWSVAAVQATIFGIKQFAESGFNWPSAGILLLGLLAGWIFIRRQQRLREPFINLALFKHSTFSVMLAINTFDFFLGFGSFFFVSQYLQLIVGLGPLEAGLWTLPSAIIQILGSLVTPFFNRWLRPGYIVAASMAFTAASFGLLTLLSHRGELWLVIVGSSLFSFALIQVTTLSTDMIISSVPPERAGMASGLSETSSELGGALGIALLGSIATVFYRGNLVQTLPAEISSSQAGPSLDTLGGALATANSLPAPLKSSLENAAKIAFSNATVFVFAACALIAMACAIVAYFNLRDLTLQPDETEA